MKPLAKIIDCPAIDKQNPQYHEFNDHCMVCAPYWKRIPICPNCERKLKHSGFCKNCRKYFKIEERV